MGVEVVTKDDLQELRVQLISDIKELIASQGQTQKPWLKNAEVRKLLGISANTLQNLRVSGKLNYSRVGGIIYYRYDDINKMLLEGLND